MKNLNRRIFYVIWSLFFVSLLVLHRAVFMHFDDFGYASLSYGFTGNLNGMSWNLKDFFNFMAWHYNNWGGRVLFYGLFVLISKFGENALQMFQAVIIFLIVFIMYKIIERKKYDFRASLLCICLFCSISIKSAVDGIYWYAASAGYVWPFLFVMLMIYILKKEKYNERKFFIIGSISSFFAGFSHEQVAVGVVVFLLFYIFFKYKYYKETNKRLLIITIFGFAGALIELLAPGNFVRSDSNIDFYSLSIVQKIIINLPKILNINFNKSNLLWVVILSVGLVYISRCIQKNILKLYNLLLSVLLIFAAFNDTISYASIIISLLFIFSFVVEFIIYSKNKNDFIDICSLFSAIAMEGMLIVAPSISARQEIPFLFMFFICVENIYCDILDDSRILIQFVFVLLAIASFFNYGTIIKGFWENKKINEINRNKLQEKAALIKAGNEINSIILYRLPNDDFTSQMPYQQDFISYWVKNYYELPSGINFIWNQLDQLNTTYEKAYSSEIIIESVWPTEVNGDFARTEDGGIAFSVTPNVIDKNLIIKVNGKEINTTIDKYFISGIIPKEMCCGEAEITVINSITKQESNKKVIHFN